VARRRWHRLRLVIGWVIGHPHVGREDWWAIETFVFCLGGALVMVVGSVLVTRGG
jgi:hypothetical protein